LGDGDDDQGDEDQQPVAASSLPLLCYRPLMPAGGCLLDRKSRLVAGVMSSTMTLDADGHEQVCHTFRGRLSLALTARPRLMWQVSAHTQPARCRSWIHTKATSRGITSSGRNASPSLDR
jgi:hypothetical protein